MRQFARERERGVAIKASYVCMNLQVRRSNKEVQLCCLGKFIITNEIINDPPPADTMRRC